MRLGFDLVGITDAAPVGDEDIRHFRKWLDEGCAGQMSYMGRNFEKRVAPAKLLPGAKSVIVVALNYKHPATINISVKSRPVGRIAGYAQYEDYHIVIRKQLRCLVEYIDSIESGYKYKICVDSAPIAERALARRAGLGFTGRNHMLINPQLGLQLFLAEIVTTLKLQTDTPLTDQCLNCDKCIRACPTGALKQDGSFDTTRCISYLTIEHKSEIPHELQAGIANRLFGCDKCIEACPYNRQAPYTNNRLLELHPEWESICPEDILEMDEQQFGQSFKHSAMRRLGLTRLKRNAQICMDNLSRARSD